MATKNSIMENKMRLHVVDALRGFAIVSIMLLHNIEHFDFYFEPAGLPQWMQAIDGVIFSLSGRYFVYIRLDWLFYDSL